MKQRILTSIVASAVLIGLAACVKVATDPSQVETFPLRATVTPDNHCTVEALGKTYTSIGQVRGAVLPNFMGSLESDGWHAIGCWVSNVDGSDGDLVITFSGNSYQQPFPIGSFTPTFEPPFGSAEKIVSVSFRASSYGPEKLKTITESTGTVTVESSATGARTIRVDVTAMKYET
jgi:hypothetical protein